ncbi:hypothetical protein ACSBR1_012403 [Camellia fascicularis]
MFSVFFLCCIFFTNHPSYGADSISADQSLFGDRTIVSAGGNFEMGFYKPGKSSNYHICIWYKTVSTQTIVWVANRDILISNKYSSELKILDGILVLLNESQTPIWSTNQNSTTSNSVVAVLGDDGNLILRDGSNSTQPIRQSFDCLVHTWLPGSKISFNKVVMDVSGQLKQLIWLEGSKEWNLFWAQPEQQCDVYALCGPFGTCNQNTQPFCNCLTGFNPKSGNDCATECESPCLKNCSCTAYAYDRNGCSIWTMDLVNLKQLLGNDPC